MPRVLYLDLKDWIDLSRGRLQRRGSEPQTHAYEALVRAVRSGQVVVPIASAHYMEIFNIKDPQQRVDLALTIGAVSRYKTFTARETLLHHELRLALASVLGGRYASPAPSPVGYGVANAMSPFGCEAGGFFPRSGTIRSVCSAFAGRSKPRNV
jgi:hypothetical protein